MTMHDTVSSHTHASHFMLSLKGVVQHLGKHFVFYFLLCDPKDQYLSRVSDATASEKCWPLLIVLL